MIGCEADASRYEVCGSDARLVRLVDECRSSWPAGVRRPAVVAVAVASAVDGLDEVRIGFAALPGRARAGLLQFAGRYQFHRFYDAIAADDRSERLDIRAGPGAGRLPYRPQRRAQRHVKLYVDVVPARLHRRHLQMLARQRLLPVGRSGAGRPAARRPAPGRLRLALLLSLIHI